MATNQATDVADVPVEDVWSKLKDDKAAVLLDVRTRAEWAFVGLPDLSTLGKDVIRIEWQAFPDSEVNSQFTQRVKAALGEAKATEDTDVFFICRSGGRSRMAAETMAAEGYRRCHNVADGFEGPLDSDRHRGKVAGWKAAKLPWVQG